MTFAWARTAAAAAVMATLALAACNKGPATVDETADVNARAAQFFLTNNAKAEGVKTLPSGVQYKILQSGPAGGESPDRNDLVRVEYEGSLTDGTVFDSSFERGQPAVFTLGTVVDGWTEALQHMKVGDEWVVYLPPEKGYGEQGQGPIPPNSVLVFRLKLLDIARAPGGETGVGSANG
ncbi:FKBP-type peptidyl-prolyl cis-trans isomerase [Brevundimonas lenta]|uniref:Peptidyl-prolyl cis-trans isomerase n=1 Tax=Brevundimonas lenta TaxID=424796 RepID=A0A7W6NNX4_9CAUL|nr:FKBP-type peptidyl-prolyl cis-trans isomerase [Brevundimonas lenta]MBB4081904.1 peptidylprolyl isomerase/FKBP-type peptidyl-prolyl cis-trans isomerase FklB [Brevundimonas lenta]